ncbi:MAG TPA: phosphotransferase [Herpetosiphonaceae bacterium]
MPPVIFDSIDEMISIAGLAALVGGAVTSIERAPLEVAHFSGNTLERVIVGVAGAERRLVLKRFAIERDWVMRLTHDHAVREVALYRHGIYARLPSICYVPIIAVARDGDGWASLMDDVSAGLPADDSLTPGDLRCYLTALAAVHIRFMSDESLSDPALGLSSLRDFVQILAAPTVEAECTEGRSHPVLEAARRGWQVFAEIAPPEAVQMVGKLAHDPEPLLALLDHMPHTLVHGDFKAANLGVWPSGSGSQSATSAEAPLTIILDWQDATKGSALLDLGYFLAISGPRLPVTKAAAIDIYRAALNHQGYRFSDQVWERDLDLGLLAGGALRLLWQKALGVQSPDPAIRAAQIEELRWWCDVTIRACRWLG